jgi:dephospho-CoA kinase
MNKDLYIIGVTGYLGSGKSTALSFLKKHDFHCVDADKIVHDLYEPGKDGWQKIKDFFGEEFLTKGEGSVNRSKLRKIVFNSAPKLRILEKIIHPLVFNEMRGQIQKSDSNKVAIEAIKFDEKRMGVLPNIIVWIDAPKDEAYKRTAKNRKISKDEYETIISLQEKPEKIDFIIKNNGTLDDLEKQIDDIISKISKLK